MRFRSRPAKAGQVYAVSGTNTVSFAIVASDLTKDGLLGFAVRRYDLDDGTDKWMAGFKVFRSLIPEPTPETHVSTYDHPVQSFSWDDFTALDGHRYRYVFHPVKGTAADLRRPGPALTLSVRTEPLYGDTHDVFFNRGVASSQAYVRSYGTDRIDDLEPARRAQALGWLSRDLDDALLKFVNQTESGDQLLGCFYEFRYEPVAQALADAITREVDVRLIVDAKDNAEGFPRDENRKMLAAVGIPLERVHQREARTSAIQHNKFMVRVRPQGPTEVWTGSTNLSLGGIHGQTNVGHWVRDEAVARAFQGYWALLATDPGGEAGDTLSVVKQKNKALREAVETLTPMPADLHEIAEGATVAFSPRLDTALLDGYATLLDEATSQGCITFAFGVGAKFKALLKDNTPQNALVFLLLEKRDRPDPDHPTAFVRINASNNVYQAWGSFLRNPVYQWAKETNAGLLGLNQHVSYIHSKFLLVDPLGEDPIVVTGSANFSEASVKENDENMLLIRGDRRTADIYLTEFNRIFNHYYFRSVTEVTSSRPQKATDDSRFLLENADWQKKYAPGGLKAKRLALYAGMTGFNRA
jgi:phosphatidylserine/phosphatidylglycerophosphate/cardiolipin synthase-like enzyme